MPAPQTSSAPGQSDASHGNLGLGFILVVIPVMAVLGWVITVAHPWIAGPLMWLISTSLAPVLITLIVYGNSYQRSFAIGAILPAAILGVLLLIETGRLVRMLTSDLEVYDDDLRVMVPASWAASMVSGLLCVGVRRLLDPRRRQCERSACVSPIDGQDPQG